MCTFLKFGLAPYSEYILHILFFMYQLRVYILYFWAMMQTNSFKIVLIFSFISSNFFVQNIFAQIFTIMHLTVCLVVSHSNFSSCCTYSEFTFVIEFKKYTCIFLSSYSDEQHYVGLFDFFTSGFQITFNLVKIHPRGGEKNPWKSHPRLWRKLSQQYFFIQCITETTASHSCA